MRAKYPVIKLPYLEILTDGMKNALSFYIHIFKLNGNLEKSKKFFFLPLKFIFYSLTYLWVKKDENLKKVFLN